VDSAILSPGAVIAGDVTHSVISSRCRVDSDAVVTDCVLLPGAVVGAGSVLERAIVDTDCVLPPNTRLGERVSGDHNGHATPNGIVLSTSAGQAATNPFMARQIA
jgi:glucose-1-phosphate adenylyltransferase